MEKQLRKLIREEIENQINHKIKFVLHELSINLFDNEIIENDETQKALDNIRRGLWENDLDSFYEAFKGAIEHSKHKEMLSIYSKSDLAKMKVFKLQDFNIGFALKKRDGKFSEIVAVFNDDPNVKGVGDDVVKAAISKGGCYLDHYDGYLTPFYEKLGFEEISRDEFDPQYDTDGAFEKKYGKQDIIYRVHKSCK